MRGTSGKIEVKGLIQTSRSLVIFGCNLAANVKLWCQWKTKALQLSQKHKMCRTLTKLRYLTEFFAPIFPSKDVKSFVKQLKTLQDVFGYINDVRMEEQLVRLQPSTAMARTVPWLQELFSVCINKKQPKPGRMRKQSGAT